MIDTTKEIEWKNYYIVDNETKDCGHISSVKIDVDFH